MELQIFLSRCLQLESRRVKYKRERSWFDDEERVVVVKSRPSVGQQHLLLFLFVFAENGKQTDYGD